MYEDVSRRVGVGHAPANCWVGLYRLLAALLLAALEDATRPSRPVGLQTCKTQTCDQRASPRHRPSLSPHVAFCGYSMPHPSEELVNLRVQTTGAARGVGHTSEVEKSTVRVAGKDEGQRGQRAVGSESGTAAT